MTVVVPILNNALGCFVAVMVVMLQLSMAVGAFHVTATVESSVSFVMGAGQLYIVGFIVSMKHGLETVTIKVQYDLLLLASVAE
jgi:hypothetical protein